MSSKYLIVKREDLDRLKKDMEGSPEELGGISAVEELDLEDGEVIRRQDLTAAPILYTYASVIRSFAELAQQDMETEPGRIEKLHDVADWAFDAAGKSEALGGARKLPD